MLRFAVVGKPVSHSKSPEIHALFSQQTGIELSYSRAEVGPEEFERYVKTFFDQGGSGLNITVPYKEVAFQLVENCTVRASLAKATNTLYMDDQQRLCGDNTDGIGLVNDIKINNKFEIARKKILILGAGGAVRGALSGLVNEEPALITILNRSQAKAIQLMSEFSSVIPLTVSGYSDPIDERFDLIINGTSMGLQGKMPPISSSLIGEHCLCYDMMYADEDTAFVSWAKAEGALAINGIGMLIEQAAESFTIWCKTRPETAAIIKKFKKL